MIVVVAGEGPSRVNVIAGIAPVTALPVAFEQICTSTWLIEVPVVILIEPMPFIIPESIRSPEVGFNAVIYSLEYIVSLGPLPATMT